MKWIKPNGTEIETRDTPEIAEYAKANGWKRPRKKSQPVPKTEPKGDD